MENCDAQTKDKKQCSKRGKINVGEHLLCWVHWDMWYRETHACTVAPEPWTCLGLEVAIDRVAVKQLRALLRNKFVSEKTENHGWLYVFRYVHDDNTENMYKIGYTDRDTVTKRIAEWPGAELLFSFKTRHAQYAESVVHCLLEHWRVYRFVLYAACTAPDACKRYVSTHYTRPARPVHDAVWASAECPEWLPQHIFDAMQNDRVTREIMHDKKVYKERYVREDEWFFCPLDYVVQVCEAVTQMIEHNQDNWHAGFIIKH